jgi:hypothetical protein
MSVRPRWTDLLGPRRAALAADVETREGRVRLVGVAARALMESRTPAGLFVGGALLAWLEQGGDLPRDFFQVVKPKSHRTVPVLWREAKALISHDGGAETDTTALRPSQPAKEK